MKEECQGVDDQRGIARRRGFSLADVALASPMWLKPLCHYRVGVIFVQTYTQQATTGQADSAQIQRSGWERNPQLSAMVR